MLSPPVPGCAGGSLSPVGLAVLAEQRPGAGCGTATPIPSAPIPDAAALLSPHSDIPGSRQHRVEQHRG